jgi:hypothetical protein
MNSRAYIDQLFEGASGVKLASKYHPKVMPFSALPVGAKMALIWYMAVDGEAWELPQDLQDVYHTKHGIKRLTDGLWKHLSYFDKAYGSARFGYVEIPTSILLDAIEKAHQGLTKAGLGYPAKPPTNLNSSKWLYAGSRSATTWPCILDDGDDILQDGWHRLGRYVEAELPQIPCVFYA